LIEIKGRRIRKLLGVVGILSRLGNVEILHLALLVSLHKIVGGEGKK
jgi:hypothetical protein